MRTERILPTFGVLAGLTVSALHKIRETLVYC